jgi:anti-sigma-K factor RskA
MHEHLVGYVCGALEADEVQLVEQNLNGDEEFRRCLERVKLILAPLECDREDCSPPDGLAARVCQMLLSRKRPPSAEGFA